MSKVWVPQKCPGCGHSVKDGEKAVLVAEVKTTAKETYGGHKRGRWTLRPLFQPKGKKALYHPECPALLE